MILITSYRICDKSFIWSSSPERARVGTPLSDPREIMTLHTIGHEMDTIVDVEFFSECK